MQWLINEFKAFKDEVVKKIDSAIEKWAQGQVEDATRLTKLEGEIRAMKARAGKNNNKEPDGQRRTPSDPRS